VSAATRASIEYKRDKFGGGGEIKESQGQDQGKTFHSEKVFSQRRDERQVIRGNQKPFESASDR